MLLPCERRRTTRPPGTVSSGRSSRRSIRRGRRAARPRTRLRRTAPGRRRPRRGRRACGDAELTLDLDHDAALRRAVELGEHDAGHVDDLAEHARLDQAVLTRGGVQHEQHLGDRRCFSMTLLTLPSSSIRPCLFCSRPAVSTMTVSTPVPTPSFTASKATLAGSVPSGPRTTATPTRSPQVARLVDGRGAERVGRAEHDAAVLGDQDPGEACRPWVVLPEPLTPTTRTTPGLPSAPLLEPAVHRRVDQGQEAPRGAPPGGRPQRCPRPASGCGAARPALGGTDADVGGDQGVLDRLPGVLVETIP